MQPKWGVGVGGGGCEATVTHITNVNNVLLMSGSICFFLSAVRLLLRLKQKGHDSNKEVGWILPPHRHHSVPPESLQEVKFRFGRGAQYRVAEAGSGGKGWTVGKGCHKRLGLSPNLQSSLNHIELLRVSVCILLSSPLLSSHSLSSPLCICWLLPFLFNLARGVFVCTGFSPKEIKNVLFSKKPLRPNRHHGGHQEEDADAEVGQGERHRQGRAGWVRQEGSGG